MTNDPYTVEMRLCNDDGMVAGDYMILLNRLRALSGHERYQGEPFTCTGHAHLAGEHIRCTSPVHPS